MKRQFDPRTPEWMDLPQPVSAELEDDLANLRTLNRWFGGVTAVLDPLKSILTTDREWSILDLATGSADIPKSVAGWCQRRNISITIDAVDFQASTLEVARAVCRDRANIRFHQADIRTYAPERTWDVVVCSLALHHFSESDAVQILRRANALATRCVIVTDLRRCLLGTLGVDLLTAVWMRAAMTRNDARASVRRAFSFAEFSELAQSAGWVACEHRRVPTFRQTVMLRK
ncbi:MAG: methyltransferase domain-containing protein [Chthoniobacterales bacterium]